MVRAALQNVGATATPDVIQSLGCVNVLQVILDLGVGKVGLHSGNGWTS